MPRAEFNDDKHYENEIADHESNLHTILADSRWIVDLAALLTLNAAVATVWAVLFRRMIETGPNTQLISGLIATGLVAVSLFSPCTRSVHEAAVVVILRIRKFFGVSYQIQERNIVYRSIWLALVNMLQLTAVAGTGLMFSEILKNASLPL